MGRHTKKPTDYHSLAASRGYRWLGPEVPKVKMKTTWVCPQGHTFQAGFDSIREGHGCPRCVIEAHRKQPCDYHALAEAHGLTWLGPEVSHVTDKTTWRCSQGHEWQGTYENIRQGHGCSQCQHDTWRKKPGDYHKLAEVHGLVWIGPEVFSTVEKTGWRCSCGHVWRDTYTRIRLGHRCPKCKQANKVKANMSV